MPCSHLVRRNIVKHMRLSSIENGQLPTRCSRSLTTAQVDNKEWLLSELENNWLKEHGKTSTIVAIALKYDVLWLLKTHTLETQEVDLVIDILDISSTNQHIYTKS